MLFAQDEPEINYSRDRGEPVIELHFDHGVRVLGQKDETPYLRIFGDGYVVVHYPVYRKNAGTYSYNLDDEQLRDLLTRMSAQGVMEFDVAANERQRQSIRRANSSGVVTHVSDDTLTRLTITLDQYGRQSQFQKIVVWYGLENDAQTYRDMTELTQLRDAVVLLTQIAESSQRTRVPE